MAILCNSVSCEIVDVALVTVCELFFRIWFVTKCGFLQNFFSCCIVRQAASFSLPHETYFSLHALNVQASFLIVPCLTSRIYAELTSVINSYLYMSKKGARGGAVG